jgi:hypothetical protein
MNSTGRKSENSGYLVILLLVVGLTAFSHSMKELTEIHQLTVDASRLVAQWSGNFTPTEIPQTQIQVVKIEKIEKLASCDSKQSAPSVELPWLNEEPEIQTGPSAVAPARPRQPKTDRIERRVISIPSEAEIARLKKRIGIDTDAFEVRVPSVQLPEAGESGTFDMPEFTFRAKARKPGASKLNPRDREMILKTLNRSINLRIAS